MKTYTQVVLLSIVMSNVFAKTITIHEPHSLLDRVVRASTRIAPTINMDRVLHGLSPLGMAAVYLIYTKPVATVDQMGFIASKIKRIVGGVLETYKSSEDDKTKSCDYGIPSLFKPLGIKIETEPLLKISCASLIKDRLFTDAKDLKRWCSDQANIIYEEFNQQYTIPEDKPLSLKERALYLYHLLSTTACRCPAASINFEVLKELTDGCTAQDLERIIDDSQYSDHEVLQQVSTYYAGKSLVYKLLHPETHVHTMICPINCSPKEPVFGKIKIRDARHMLVRSTRDASIDDIIVTLAGPAAAHICEIPISTIFLEESETRIQDLLKNSFLTKQATEELRNQLHDQAQSLLENHKEELGMITSLLMEQWEVSNSELEEILALKK